MYNNQGRYEPSTTIRSSHITEHWSVLLTLQQFGSTISKVSLVFGGMDEGLKGEWYAGMQFPNLIKSFFFASDKVIRLHESHTLSHLD